MKRKPLIRHLLRVYATQSIVLIIALAFSTFVIGRALHEHEIGVVILALAVAVLSIVGAVHIVRRVIEPLKSLQSKLEAFVRDQALNPLPPTGIEEVDKLARTLNETAAELHQRIASVTLQNDELSAVLSSMQEGVIVLDLDQRIVRLNRSAAGLFRITQEEAHEKPLTEILRNIDLLNLLTQVTDRTGAETEIHETGGDRHFHVRADALRDINGIRKGMLLVINDITTLRKGDVMRRDFVANVSHELRTPITSILGSIDTLREGADDSPEDRVRFLEMAGRQAARLQAIVDDLLALASIEDGTQKNPLERNVTPVAPLIENVLQAAHAVATNKNITLSHSCDASIQASLNAHLMERALSNLVNNAVQYSDAGTTVKVAAHVNRRMLVISVSDTGPGIEQKHLSRLFERFYRVDKSRSRQIGGTGLGLAIVKHIAIAHQGNVTVQSQFGRGSTFTISVPVEA